MADNTTFQTTLATPPSGLVVATDDVSGVHFQKVKIDVGGDGASVVLSNSNPLPISDAGGSVTVDGAVTATLDSGTLAGQTAVTADYDTGAGTQNLAMVGLALPASGGAVAGGTFTNPVRTDPTGTTAQPISDGGGSLTVDGSVTANAGTNLNTSALALESGGNLAAAVTALQLIDNAIAGSEMQVDVVGALPAGNNNIGDVDVASVVPGTGATNLGKAEDSAHTTGDVGVMMLAVRQDSQSALAADGDYLPPTIDSVGGLRVSIVAGAGSGGTAAADDADFTAGTTQGTPAMGVYESSPTSVTDGDLGTVGITAQRALKVNLRDASGNEVSVGGGTQYTEDAAAATNPVGNAIVVVRDDARSGSLTSADGDNVALRGTNSGELYVKHTDAIPVTDNGGALTVDGSVTVSGSVTANAGTNLNTSALALESGGNLAGAATSLAVIDDWDETDRAKVNIIVGQAGVAAGAGAVGVTVPRVTLASDDPAVTALQILDNAISGNEMQVDVLTLPNVTLAAGTNTNEVVGDAAHDAAVAGNPVLMGSEARSSDGTAVANGDVTRNLATLLGKSVVYPHALPGSTWSYAAASGGITNTTGVTAKAAAGAGIRNYVTSIQVINGHATVSTDVQIRDGASGTVLWRGFAQAAGGGCAVKCDPPLRGTANTLLEIACGTTGSATYFNLQGFVAAE